jgi:hypothetical protein
MLCANPACVWCATCCAYGYMHEVLILSTIKSARYKETTGGHTKCVCYATCCAESHADTLLFIECRILCVGLAVYHTHILSKAGLFMACHIWCDRRCGMPCTWDKQNRWRTRRADFMCIGCDMLCCMKCVRGCVP